MPRKAFLKKKSLLDRFKDDYATHTGYIQSARAKHTWNNPLTRRKRTKELNRWIKSFAGKDHIHKLARFNATNAGRYESMYDEAMSLKGFLENLTEKLTKQFDLDLEEVQAYLNSHTQEMQELLDDKELSLKEKVLFVRSEITGEKDEAKQSESLVLPNPTIIYRGTSEDAKKASHYISKILADKGLGWGRVGWIGPKNGEFHYGHPEKDVYTVCLRGSNDLIKDSFAVYKDVFGNDFWNNCDADPQGWVDPLTINRYDVATPRQESKKSEFYMDGDDSEDYYYCHRCGRVTPSYELDAHGGFCSDCDARWTAEHENESKEPADEKLGYEKGHKNSRGENAPWVIRSHEDNRILASFANKKDAEEHLKRMKQYSKTEARQPISNSDLLDRLKKIDPVKAEYIIDVDHDRYGYWVYFPDSETDSVETYNNQGCHTLHEYSVTDMIQSFKRSKILPKSSEAPKQEDKNLVESKKSEAVEESDFIKDFRARMESMIGEPYDEDDILGYGWVWKSEDIGYPNGNKTYYEYFSLSDDGVPYTMEIGYNSFNETISSFKMWQEASEKKSEASNLAGYTSDIVSELDTIWGCGEDGAKRLVGKYADVIQQNYTDGDLLASETAKFIAGQENLKESRNKSESKKSEGRLELVDTIIIPKWLWEAYNFGNDYGEDLDEHEQEILAKFQEKYSDLYLDDHDEEADFHSRNDFDEYGGPCYEVDVYEMKKA